MKAPNLRPLPTLKENRKGERDRRGWEPGRRTAQQDVHAVPDKRTAPNGTRRSGLHEDRRNKSRAMDDRAIADGVTVRRPPPRLVPKPKDKSSKSSKSSSGEERPFQEFGDPGDNPFDFLNRDREVESYSAWVDAENERKDAEWEKAHPEAARRERKAGNDREKAQLDQDVRDSPNVEAFLGKMRDKAKEQQGHSKPPEEGRPNFKSPLPPYHTPPDPSGKSPPRRSEPRSEYDKGHEFKSKAVGGSEKPGARRPKKVTPGSPPVIPSPRKPRVTAGKAVKERGAPPVIPSPRKPTVTPPLKGGEAGILRFVTRKPRR